MNRNRLIRGSALIILFLITAASVFTQNITGIIRETNGTVEIKANASGNWVQARPGDLLRKDTVISTGFRSSAVIAVGNSSLTVRPLTRLSLEELLTQNDSETISINLNTGRVRAEVAPPLGGKTNFSIQSPSATASVRGTEFEMDTVSIQVLSGEVSYTPTPSGQNGQPGRSVSVSAGQESWIDADTGVAVTPIAAAETSRSLPNLPGQEAGTISNAGARKETTGTLNADLELGGKVIVEIDVQQIQ